MRPVREALGDPQVRVRRGRVLLSYPLTAKSREALRLSGSAGWQQLCSWLSEQPGKHSLAVPPAYGGQLLAPSRAQAELRDLIGLVRWQNGSGFALRRGWRARLARLEAGSLEEEFAVSAAEARFLGEVRAAGLQGTVPSEKLKKTAQKLAGLGLLSLAGPGRWRLTQRGLLVAAALAPDQSEG